MKQLQNNIIRVCKKLKEMREEQGLTQIQVAERAEVSQQVISRIECGENVSMLTMFRILRVLKKDIRIKNKTTIRKLK